MSKFWKFKIFGPLILVVIFVNLFLPTKEFTLEEKARNTILAGFPGRARHVYSEMLGNDPNNIDLHRKKIKSHFDSGTEDQSTIKSDYRTLSQSSDKTKSDIGLYALGYMQAIQKNDDGALNFYLKIKNTKLPFVNHSIGHIYLKQKKYDLAENHVLKELENQGNIKGAYFNLSKIYYESGNQQELEKLLSNEVLSENVSSRVRRHHYFQTGEYKEYVKVGFKLGNFTNLGLMGAIIILAIWLVFLRKIDIFEPEQPHHILITLLLGCFFSMLCTPIYDLFSVSFGFELNGNYINDLLFCIFGIGFIEETLKIIPFFIIFRFKSIINESVDYIIYASVSALGFAFMENLIYFHPGGLDDMVGRMLTAVVLHMALTSFIAFGLLYADYKKKGSRVKCFLMAFVVSCVVHGVYDFWILSDGWVGDFGMISIFILFFAVISYSFIINNALNLSEFDTGGIEVVRTFEFLVLAVTAVIIYQYLVIATEYGVSNGNVNLLGQFVFGFISFYTIVFLGHFNISKSTWRSPIDYFPDGDGDK